MRTVHDPQASIACSAGGVIGGRRVRVELPIAVRAQIVGWSRAAVSREACGVLVGTRAAGRVAVLAALLSRNLSAESHRRFVIDPGDVVRAERDAQKSGLELVGFWHSHPRGAARPSAHDQSAAWPGLVSLVVGLRGRARISAWVGGRGALEAADLVTRTSCTRRLAGHNRRSRTNLPEHRP